METLCRLSYWGAVTVVRPPWETPPHDLLCDGETTRRRRAETKSVAPALRPSRQPLPPVVSSSTRAGSEVVVLSLAGDPVCRPPRQLAGDLLEPGAGRRQSPLEVGDALLTSSCRASVPRPFGRPPAAPARACSRRDDSRVRSAAAAATARPLLPRPLLPRPQLPPRHRRWPRRRPRLVVVGGGPRGVRGVRGSAPRAPTDRLAALGPAALQDGERGPGPGSGRRPRRGRGRRSPRRRRCRPSRSPE